MSCGVFSRSMSRQQASSNLAVVSPVAMAGLSDGASVARISSAAARGANKLFWSARKWCAFAAGPGAAEWDSGELLAPFQERWQEQPGRLWFSRPRIVVDRQSQKASQQMHSRGQQSFR